MSANQARPLSILHVCGEGHASGQTRVIIDLARAQSAAGHRVSAACPADSALDQGLRAAGVAPTALPLDGAPQCGRAIAAAAAACGAEVVNAHSSRDRDGVSWARDHAGLDAAVVFTRHVRTLTFPLKLWWQSRRAERVIAVSQDVASRLVARGVPRQRIVVVPNGLPPGFVLDPPPPAAVAQAREQIARLPGAPVVGVIGRRKAQDVLLRAARHIERPLNFAFIGIGAEPTLERLAADVPRHAVAFVPFVSDPRPYYACLAISALPSLQEGLSIAQLESMALGIPFVGSSAAGIPDLTTDGVDGLLVPHADTRAWARAIERLLGDPALAARMAAAGRRKVLESYTFAATLACTEAVYRDAIVERSRGRRPVTT